MGCLQSGESARSTAPESRGSQLCGGDRERAPPPRSDLQGRQGFQSGYTGCAAFTLTEHGLGRCALHLFSTLRSTADRKAATALLVGLQ